MLYAVINKYERDQERACAEQTEKELVYGVADKAHRIFVRNEMTNKAGECEERADEPNEREYLMNDLFRRRRVRRFTLGRAL